LHLFVLLLSALFLVSCEKEVDTPAINCDLFPNREECQESSDDVPSEIDENYGNLGHGSDIIYERRDLVQGDCDYLDNIGDWQPVWCDEFNYSGLPDSSHWNYDVGGNGWGNNELQYYTSNDLDNAFVKDGYLTIRTIKEPMQSNQYTSARLVTKGKGDWLYGKIQVRAKLPAGKGTWPAIWMLPTDWVYGNWPSSGEIDIMEYVGYDPNSIHGTIHTAKNNHMLGTQLSKTRTVLTAEEEFHLYEMEWQPGEIILYIDGNTFATFRFDPQNNIDVDNTEAWPFDQKFHLLINTAFGGNWGGALGVDDTILPADFIIDYVRVYQKDYAGMDTQIPEQVTNLATLSTKPTSVYLSWDKAVDDVAIKQYKIYQNGSLIDTTSLNGQFIENLTPNTDYTFSIKAEDFAGNVSKESTISVRTAKPTNILSIIEAENYLSMSGVQTEQTQDLSGELNVGWIDSGDSLTYLLEVSESGTYQIDFRLASLTNGAHFDMYQDEQLLLHMDTQPTGSWQTWETFSSDSVYLSKGIYTFKLVATDSGFNINYFTFRRFN
jgi:beta-glucanase (GH16 family)